jgi:hypothetical protein
LPYAHFSVDLKRIWRHEDGDNKDPLTHAYEGRGLNHKIGDAGESALKLIGGRGFTHTPCFRLSHLMNCLSRFMGDPALYLNRHYAALRGCADDMAEMYAGFARLNDYAKQATRYVPNDDGTFRASLKRLVPALAGPYTPRPSAPAL